MGGFMLKKLLPILLLSSACVFAIQEEPEYYPENPPQEKDETEVAGPENRYEYTLYDRQQNRKDQEQRQQYYYQQSQDQNNSQPQYNRQPAPRSQYFNPRDE